MEAEAQFVVCWLWRDYPRPPIPLLSVCLESWSFFGCAERLYSDHQHQRETGALDRSLKIVIRIENWIIISQFLVHARCIILINPLTTSWKHQNYNTIPFAYFFFPRLSNRSRNMLQHLNITHPEYLQKTSPDWGPTAYSSVFFSLINSTFTNSRVRTQSRLRIFSLATWSWKSDDDKHVFISVKSERVSDRMRFIITRFDRNRCVFNYVASLTCTHCYEFLSAATYPDSASTIARSFFLTWNWLTTLFYISAFICSVTIAFSSVFHIAFCLPVA